MRQFVLGLLTAGTYPFVHSLILFRSGFFKATQSDVERWAKVTAALIPIIYIALLVLFNVLNWTTAGDNW